MIVLIEHMKKDPATQTALFLFLLKTLLYALPFVAIGTGALMVSRIEYPHLANQYLRGKKPIIHLVWIAVIVALIWQTGIQMALVVCFGGYALTGLSRRIWNRLHTIHPAAVGASTTSESAAVDAPDIHERSFRLCPHSLLRANAAWRLYSVPPDATLPSFLKAVSADWLCILSSRLLKRCISAAVRLL